MSSKRSTSRALAACLAAVSLASLTACSGGDPDAEPPLDVQPVDDAGVSECEVGERRCDGLVPQTCDHGGRWSSITACDYVCEEGACGGVCVPGAKKCDGLVPASCDDKGAWVSGDACENLCEEGACGGVCVPGAKKCDGLVPASCDDKGAWVSEAACDYVCTEGVCTGECVPGDQRCADGTSLDTCDATGAWHASACSHFCSATTQQCACDPGYGADGTSCTPLDFCSAPHGGCSPNASCSQVEITPICECEPGYEGDGYSCSAPAAVVFSEGFDDVTTLEGEGWLLGNRSSPQTSGSWFQGLDHVFGALDGEPSAYIAANFGSTNQGGTISTWLATPVLDFGALAEASFYTRTTLFEGEVWADRIEVRLCTSEPCDLPSDSDVGEYSSLLLSINPLLVDDYPREWTKFTVTNADGLPTSGKGRIAIRYYVTDAGWDSANSNYIGVDRFVWKVGAPAHRVGGTLTGLSTGIVVLSLNGGEMVSLSSDGAFEFAHKLDEGTSYSVSIYEQPEGQSCAIENATGSVVVDDIVNIQVVCVDD